jgi:hypothetical protein
MKILKKKYVGEIQIILFEKDGMFHVEVIKNGMIKTDFYYSEFQLVNSIYNETCAALCVYNSSILTDFPKRKLNLN